MDIEKKTIINCIHQILTCKHLKELTDPSSTYILTCKHLEVLTSNPSSKVCIW